MEPSVLLGHFTARRTVYRYSVMLVLKVFSCLFFFSVSNSNEGNEFFSIIELMNLKWKKKKTWSQKNKETNIKTANPVTFNKMNKCGIFPSSLSGRWGGWLLLTKWHQMIHQQFTRVSLEPGVKNAKWLRKVADHTRVRWGHSIHRPRAQASKGLIFSPGSGCQIQPK